MHEALNLDLEQGRDRLLEYNSCRQPAADRLCEQARAMENPEQLTAYTETLLDALGVELRPHSEACLIARPGEHLSHPVPGLPDDGLTFTCDRDVALAFEDAHYFSWEHPVLRDTMDMLLAGEAGNCCVCTVTYPQVRPGTLLLECLYVLEGGHHELARQFHLAPMLLRVIVDEQARPHHDTLSPQQISAVATRLDNRIAQQVVQAREAVLRDLLGHCESHATAQAPALVSTAGRQRRSALQGEIDRLRALSRVNSAIREEESRFFAGQLQLLDALLDSVSPRLDAIRVMVAT
jgi:ATP-dependent helicase HepA